MAYVIASDLAAQLPQNIPISASTVPLAWGEVDILIGRIAAELNAHAAKAGYIVPVSTTATAGGYALMQKWNLDGEIGRAHV